MTARWVVTAPAVAAVVLLGCAGADDGAPAAGSAGRTVVVFAAASTADPVGRLAAEVEARSPGLDVQVNLASSDVLALQVAEGAPAEVLVAAGGGAVDRVGDRAVDPRVFATDDLVLAAPAGNPAGVRATADLGRSELRVGRCVRSAPCGELAERVLASSGVVPSVDTEEPDAASLLSKVASGDLDVALLYRRQVASAGPSVSAVELDPPVSTRVEYVVTALRGPDGSPPSPEATALVERIVAAGDGLFAPDDGRTG